MGNNEKDRWDKLAIIFKPLGGLIAAVLVAGIGYYGNSYLEKKQNKEIKIQLYTELMSNREQSESELRKDMFTSIIESFLKSESTTLEAKVLNLELLAYNFHESLNLKPLFLHLKRQIEREAASDSSNFIKRLKKVAREIKRKQLAILEGAGDKRDYDIPFDYSSRDSIQQFEFCLELDGHARNFRLTVESVNLIFESINLRLEVWPQIDTCSTQIENNQKPELYLPEVDASFDVDFYDFPMIDNTRLTNDQRCAVVLKDVNRETSTIAITVIYFPGSHASLKEKPYYEDIVKKLLSEPLESG